MKLIRDASSTDRLAIFAIDVGKDDLHLYTEVGADTIETALDNRTDSIESMINELDERTKGWRRLLVVESTGTYHQPLLRAAERAGFETAWASGEKVAKMRVLEFGDIGKTDQRDPKAIFRLAERGYLLKRRRLESRYQRLREWHHIYSCAEKQQLETKITIHDELNKLFPDYDFKTEFFYTQSGSALVHRFGANPHRIKEAGKDLFRQSMREHAPRIQFQSIDRLWRTANLSLQGGPAELVSEVIEIRLRQLYQDFETTQERKEQAREAMENLYDSIREEDDERLPKPVRGVITRFHLARILAETGPLSDFESWRQLYRFAGLNLREKRSGKFRGRTRVVKKGRVLLRKVLSHVALSLVKRTRLFGPYYHHKRDVEKMVGAKAMTAVSRKILKMLFGWYRSGAHFDESRVFQCASQHQKAA